MNGIRQILLLLLFTTISQHQFFVLGQNEKQLTGIFNVSTEHVNIKSGPILLLNTETILISMFEYEFVGVKNPEHGNTGNLIIRGQPVDPDLQYIYFMLLILDNDGNTSEELPSLQRTYFKENLYLQIERGQTIGTLSSIIIINEIGNEITQVPIEIEDVLELKRPTGYHQTLAMDGKYVFRYPKCCPIGMYKTVDDCLPINITDNIKKDEERIPIYFNNETGYDDVPLDVNKLIYKPFHYQPNCPSMYFLDKKDTSFMLLNGRFLSELDGQFACVDYVEEITSFVERPFICIADDNLEEFIISMNQIYVILMFASAFSLLLWTLALFILLVTPIKLETKPHIVFFSMTFSLFYALHIITLALARLLGVDSFECKLMGYLYQFLLLSSFSSLFALLFEAYYHVRSFADTKRNSACHYCYYVWIYAVPIATTILSIVTNEMSIFPWFEGENENNLNVCWLRSDKKVYYYYVPIIIIITCCVILQLYAVLSIRKKADFLKEEYYTMSSLGAYLSGIMIICWTMEVVAFYYEAPKPFWFAVDGLNSMQGLAIFCAFSCHYSSVWKKLCKCCSKKKLPRSRVSLDLELSSPLNRNTEHMY